MSGDGGLDPARLATGSSEFHARIVELAPAEALRFEPGAWADEIVFLTAGELELECRKGERCRFEAGAVLCLSALPLAVVRSVGEETARLLAVSRRRQSGPRSSG